MTELLGEAYQGLRRAWDRDGGLTVPARHAALGRLRGVLTAHAERFAETLDADNGGRSRHETLIAEVLTVLGAIDHTRPRLARWARPQRVWPGWRFWPARARIVSQPVGVVGILGPANYPLQLTLLPLVGAVAAGCRVLVKASELTPRTAALLARCLDEAFGRDHVAAVEGGVETAIAVTRLPLDHLVFTGSTANGRRVMAEAASNLTPVTLELGGKSPAVLGARADLGRAARAVMAGKLLNAGQTCVAPDYVLVPHERLQAFVAALGQAARALYPDPAGPSYTAIRDADARSRLRTLAAGDRAVPLFDTALPDAKVAPTVLLDPAPDGPAMTEEIFGPVLPVIGYGAIDDAVAVINARPRPLALYWFGPQDAAFATLLARTRSGTVAVDETVLHAAVEALPFGGTGASGMGAYHGRRGFDTFSHRRPIFVQSRFSPTRLLQPPYGARADRLLRLLLR